MSITHPGPPAVPDTGTASQQPRPTPEASRDFPLKSLIAPRPAKRSRDKARDQARLDRYRAQRALQSATAEVERRISALQRAHRGRLMRLALSEMVAASRPGNSRPTQKRQDPASRMTSGVVTPRVGAPRARERRDHAGKPKTTSTQPSGDDLPGGPAPLTAARMQFLQRRAAVIEARLVIDPDRDLADLLAGVRAHERDALAFWLPASLSASLGGGA